MKQCNKCKAMKPLSFFARDKRLKDGRRGDCKLCNSTKRRDEYAERPEVAGRIKAANRAQYQKNADARRLYARHRYAEDRERRKAWQRNYTATVGQNPETKRICYQRRRARIANAPAPVVAPTAVLLAQVLDAFDGECAYCSNPFEHWDHQLPIARGGADCMTNLVPACAPCNLSKGSKTLEEWG